MSLCACCEAFVVPGAVLEMMPGHDLERIADEVEGSWADRQSLVPNSARCSRDEEAGPSSVGIPSECEASAQELEYKEGANACITLWHPSQQTCTEEAQAVRGSLAVIMALAWMCEPDFLVSYLEHLKHGITLA
jgi:hypothetical protein